MLLNNYKHESKNKKNKTCCVLHISPFQNDVIFKKTFETKMIVLSSVSLHFTETEIQNMSFSV